MWKCPCLSHEAHLNASMGPFTVLVLLQVDSLLPVIPGTRVRATTRACHYLLFYALWKEVLFSVGAVLSQPWRCLLVLCLPYTPPYANLVRSPTDVMSTQAMLAYPAF